MGNDLSKLDKTNRIYITPELSRIIHLEKEQKVLIKTQSGKLIIKPVTSKDIDELL